MQPRKRKLGALQKRGSLETSEWNFGKDKQGKERVPEDELVACCYWEYARESNFIRRVVKRMKDVDQRKVTHPLVTAGKPWVQTHCLRLLEDAGAKVEQLVTLRLGTERDYSRYYRQMHEAALADPELVRDNELATRLYSLGPSTVELFQQLPFPKPWQSLTLAQRNKGKDFVPTCPKPVAFAPFQVCKSHDIASELYHIGLRNFKAQQEKWGRLAELSQQGVAGLKESAELREQLSEPQTPLLVRGDGGVDSFIAQINWGEFRASEIVKCFEKWVKAERTRRFAVTEGPEGARGLRGARGHGPREWRARLMRLGLLRLRHDYTTEETLAIVAARLPVAQRKKSMLLEPGECNRGAREAVDDFQALFRSLDLAEKPRSWPIK